MANYNVKKAVKMTT